MRYDIGTYTVTITKAIRGVRVVSWRRKNGRSNLGSKFIPYHLAMFLNLMPTKASAQFSNALYGFRHKDFDELDADPSGPVVRVTKRGPLRKVVTIDLSKA